MEQSYRGLSTGGPHDASSNRILEGQHQGTGLQRLGIGCEAPTMHARKYVWIAVMRLGNLEQQ